MLTNQNNYTIDTHNENTTYIRTRYTHKKINHLKDAKLIAKYLETEIPSETLYQVKRMLGQMICNKELLKLKNKLFELHSKHIEKNHIYRHSDEYDECVIDKISDIGFIENFK